MRLGVWTSILTPPHPFTVLPTCEPCYSPFGGRWTILQMWAGWVACEGMLEYSLPLLSLLLLPLAFWEGDWHGQPEARQLLPLHVPWESVSHRQDPHYSFLQEPVQSYCFTSAWNCLKVLHWQLSPLGKHIKLANKSLWGQHIKWFPA